MKGESAPRIIGVVELRMVNLMTMMVRLVQKKYSYLDNKIGLWVSMKS